MGAGGVRGFMDLVLGAANRVRAEEVHQLRAGVNALSAMSTSAALVGAFGCLVGIVGAFGGICGEKSALFAAMTAAIGEGLVPGAIGIAVSLLALATRECVTAIADHADLEMRAAAIDLANRLARLP